MAEFHEYRETSHFTAGAVGEPGARTFYLQVGDAEGFKSVKLEKQQVQALATFLRTVLQDLPSPDEDPVPVALIETAEPPLFVVGQIAVGVNEPDGEVVLVVEELVPDDDHDDDDDEIDDVLSDVSDGSELRVHLSVDQAASFIATSDALMEGGRPPCRLCGQPLDPTGHACPRLN